MITQISDYIGYFKLSKNQYTNEQLQAYIDRFEEYVLRDLLQCDYDEFIADLVDGVPTSAKWLDLYNKFYLCDECGEFFSLGIKDMVSCYVFYNYSKDSYIQSTITGTVKLKGSASEPLASQNSKDFIIYNQYVKSYNAIMHKALTNEYEYGFNLKCKEIINQFL